MFGLHSVNMILYCLVSAALSSRDATTRELPCTNTVHPSRTKLLPHSAMECLLLMDMSARCSPRRTSSSLQVWNSYVISNNHSE